MGNIDSKIRTYWPELQKEFPGFEKPQVIPGAAIRREALVHHMAYMVDQIDEDPTALYIFIKGNPKNGPCDRDTAVDFFETLMVKKGQPIPSSYQDEYGMDPHEAADMEVLPRPADKRQRYGNDRIFAEFQRQFEEEMAKMDQEDKAAKDQAFKDKFGFDRNDPDIIDVDVDADGKAEPVANGRAVEKAAGNTVGAPRPILYCVVLRPGFGAGELGYDGGRHDLGHRRGPGLRRLREEDIENMMDEALTGGNSVSQLLDELIDAVGKNSPMGNDLLDIKEKYNLNTVTAGLTEESDTNNIEKTDPTSKHVEGIDNVIDALSKVKTLDEATLSQEDLDNIADMFAGYSGVSQGTRDVALARFMQSHAAELKSLANGSDQASDLRDLAHARDIGNDDLDENDILKGRKHNAHIDEEEDIDEVDAFGARKGYFIEFVTAEGDDYLDIVFDTANAPKSVYRSKAEADRDAKKFSIQFTKDRAESFEDEDYDSGDKEVFMPMLDPDDPINDPTITAIVRHGDEWSNDVVSVFENGVAKPEDVVRMNVANVDEEDEVLNESVIAHSNFLAKEIW